jgi:hypothetical protein
LCFKDFSYACIKSKINNECCPCHQAFPTAFVLLTGILKEGSMELSTPKTAMEWRLEEGTTTLTVSVAPPFVNLFFLLSITSPNPQNLLPKSASLLVELLILNAQLALCRYPMINLLVKGCLRTRHALHFNFSAQRGWRSNSKSMTTSWESRLHLWRCTCTTGSVLLHRKGWSLRRSG